MSIVYDCVLTEKKWPMCSNSGRDAAAGEMPHFFNSVSPGNPLQITAHVVVQ